MKEREPGYILANSHDRRQRLAYDPWHVPRRGYVAVNVPDVVRVNTDLPQAISPARFFVAVSIANDDVRSTTIGIMARGDVSPSEIPSKRPFQRCLSLGPTVKKEARALRGPSEIIFKQPVVKVCFGSFDFKRISRPVPRPRRIEVSGNANIHQ